MQLTSNDYYYFRAGQWVDFFIPGVEQVEVV